MEEDNSNKEQGEVMGKESSGIAGKIATYLGIPLATIASCLLIVGQYREKVDNFEAIIKTELASKAMHVAEYQDAKLKLMLVDSRVNYLTASIDGLLNWKNQTSESLVQIKADLTSQNKILIEIRDDLRTIKGKP